VAGVGYVCVWGGAIMGPSSETDVEVPGGQQIRSFSTSYSESVETSPSAGLPLATPVFSRI